MNCPYCGRPNAMYISHQDSDLFERRRARQCKSCKEVFLTVERPAEDTEVTAEEARRHMDLLVALGKLKVETGSLACQGCGHEHNCGIHGCAIIRAAIKEMKKVEARRNGWIPVEEKLPEPYETVIVSVDTLNGYGDHISLETLASYDKSTDVWKDGLEGSPVTKAWYERVTHWMPMPEPPEVSDDG